jgi:PilZ domain
VTVHSLVSGLRFLQAVGIVNTKVENSRRQLVRGTSDRRENARFLVIEEVRYRVLKSRTVQFVGVGKTVDVSSGGILFTTSEPLPTGRFVEISMNWPARLDGTCPLQLVATGRIVRADTAKAVMRIEHYEFKTRSSAALTVGA